MKVIEVKKGFPAVDGAPEIKVPGKIYMPEIKAVAAVEDSYVVSMTQSELNILAALTWRCKNDGTFRGAVFSMYDALCTQVRGDAVYALGEYSVVRQLPR